MATTVNASYFYGFDDLYGWGNRSYFSFFSEFNRPWHGLGILEATILFVLFAVSLAGNTAIILTVFKVRHMKTITNCFIANLALADVLFTSGSPLIAIVRITGTWVLGKLVCHLLVYVEFVCGFAVIWTMTLISVDRYRCIVKSNSGRITVTTALLILGFIWTFGFLGFIPIALFFTVKEFSFGNSTIRICTLVWPQASSVQISVVFVTCVFLFGFAVPLSVMSFNYYTIFQTFWKARRAVTQKDAASGSSRKLCVRTGSMSRSRRLRSLRVIRTLVLLVFLFFAMWLPIFASFIAIQYDGSFETHKMHSWVLIVSGISALANACVNPFVYVFINEKFRSLSLLSCFRSQKKTEQSSSKGDDANVCSASAT